MSSDMSQSPAHRLLRDAREALNAYSIRASLGLVLSLLVMVVLTRVPLYQAPSFVGWGPEGGQERIHLSELTTEAPEQTDRVDRASLEAPVTLQDGPQSAATEPPPETPEPQPESPTETSTQSHTLTAAQLTALGPAGQRPQIMGGAGSFYLSIDYPEEARRRGIQGRVILDFIVDTEGQTQDVRILKSLHPSCDSSAVAALMRTRFVPGKRNGEPIPVRMRLPVRFQLVNLAAKNEPSPSPRPLPDGKL